MRSRDFRVNSARSKLALISIAVGVGCLLVLVIGQNINAANMTGNISSTASGIKNYTSAGNTATNNNVTAASGNNGHIYRGGAAAGSGGE